MGSCAARTGEDGDTLGLLQDRGGGRQVAGRRQNSGTISQKAEWRGSGLARHHGDVARHHHNRDSALGDGGAHGDRKNPRHLLGLRDHAAVVAAILEGLLRVGLLKIGRAQLRGGNLRGDGQNGHATAMAVIKPINEVEIARAAAACTNRQAIGQVRVGASGESSRFLMPNMDPRDLLVLSNGVRDAVQGVARKAVHAGHAR